MENPRFFYTPEIDTKIPSLFKETQDRDVLSFAKFQQGEENHVYSVTTTQGKVVLRVFGTPYWMGEEKMTGVEKQLQAISFPHPALLHVSLGNTYFPYGFMVSEFVEGVNGKEAIESGKVSFTDFHKQLLSQLRQLHSVSNKTFGFSSEEGFDSIVDFKLDQVNWCFDQLAGQPDVYEMKEQVYEKVKSKLTPLQEKIKPVLVHYDPMPSNCIYTPEGRIVLIDWDNAASECFMRDIAWLTYWETEEERQETLWRLCKEAYQDFGFTESELQTLQEVYHLCISAELLPYYLISQKNVTGYEVIKKRVETLLAA